MCGRLSASKWSWILVGVSSLPLMLGVCSLCLGIWLMVVVVDNARLPPDQQLYFEKVLSPWNSGDGGLKPDPSGHHLDNESPFSHTPVNNLFVYLLALSFVAVLGGGGRVVATTFFSLHLIRNRVTNQLLAAWLGLSLLAVTIQVLLAYDILHTLSHNDVAPPYSRDFYFTNDSRSVPSFGTLCRLLRCFTWVDLLASAVSQVLVLILYRLYSRHSHHLQ